MNVNYGEYRTMMKQEFEAMIGKTVDYDTFERYQAMYMATDVDKHTFVSMLDVDAIPESKASIEAKAEAQRIRTEIEAVIYDQSLELTSLRARYNEYREWSKGEDAYGYWKQAAKSVKRLIDDKRKYVAYQKQLLNFMAY